MTLAPTCVLLKKKESLYKKTGKTMIYIITFLAIFLIVWLIATGFGLTQIVSKFIFPVKLMFYMYLILVSIAGTVGLHVELEKQMAESIKFMENK